MAHTWGIGGSLLARGAPLPVCCACQGGTWSWRLALGIAAICDALRTTYEVYAWDEPGQLRKLGLGESGTQLRGSTEIEAETDCPLTGRILYSSQFLSLWTTR